MHNSGSSGGMNLVLSSGKFFKLLKINSTSLCSVKLVSGAIELHSYILGDIIIISLVNGPVQMCNKCSETVEWKMTQIIS